MLVPFTPPQRRTVERLSREYKFAISLIAESMGLEEITDVHKDGIGFIVPDPPGFVPPAPTTPETTSVT